MDIFELKRVGTRINAAQQRRETAIYYARGEDFELLGRVYLLLAEIACEQLNTDQEIIEMKVQ